MISGWLLWCQRPKRALSISTDTAGDAGEDDTVCQRPKRALSISTYDLSGTFNRRTKCVNALNGLFPFLQA